MPIIKNAVAAAGGQTHSLALTSEGTVWAWGGNLDGQLGDGNKVSRETPKQVEQLRDVIAIDADWTSSFAVKQDGTVWVWGGFFPEVPIQLPKAADIISLSAGYGNFMMLKKDGTVWTYNYGMVQVEGIEDIVQIAVGGQYTYGLKKDGTIWFWGSSGIGKVNGSSVNNNSAPSMLPGMFDAAAIQASASGPLILKKDGTVWASGDNPGGQLGIGSYKSSEIPVQVIGLKKIKRIAAHGTGYRSMAVRADGTLWSWGIGATGDGTKWDRTLAVGIKSYDSQLIEKDPIFVDIDGKTLRLKQPPIKQNNRTMVPIRAIFNGLGAVLDWDSNTRTITASKGSNSIVLVVGSTTALVNGESIILDAAPTIVNGSTLVPVRFISASLGANVEWDSNSKTVIITTRP